MKAVQLVQVGAPLEEREIATPSPRAHEILVAIKAAGICHSDVHYRDGTGHVSFTPITLGHEVAGVVAAVGEDVVDVRVGDRVAAHYLMTCGNCEHCVAGLEQFCAHGRMLGKDAHGGYAEFIVIPARNAIPVPDNVDMAVAAIMMCSTATAFHALHKARMRAGDRVAIFGAGGLGVSGIQLAHACGASEVFAIDIAEDKRLLAERFGARAIDPARATPDEQIRVATNGRGVDVALEFTGIAVVQEQALAALGVQGRVALTGIGKDAFHARGYPDVINREAEIIGVSDHTRAELVTLMEFARNGSLDLATVIGERIPLDAGQINAKLDALANFHSPARTVIEAEA